MGVTVEPQNEYEELAILLQSPPSSCKCADFLLRLQIFLDNELPAEDCAKLRAHLESCVRCQSEVASMENLKLRLKTSCCEAAPGTLKARIQATFRTQIIES